MEPPFEISFSTAHRAHAVHVQQLAEMQFAISALALPFPRPAIVVVGGAAEMSDGDIADLRLTIASALVSIIEELGAIVIDGGVDSGVMRLMGQIRATHFPESPLVGVALEQQVNWPGRAFAEERVPLEPHHSHFVLVPGVDWGEEAIWMSRLATSLSSPLPSLTLLINGGEVAYQEVAQSVRDGRPVIVVAGSGRLADQLTRTLAGELVEPKAPPVMNTRLIQVVSNQQGHVALQRTIKTILTAKERHGTERVSL
jgi:SLOG in TRPM, prokaryote